MTQEQLIDDSEDIARIVSSEWIVDGQLQQTAFTLNPNETYLSVNRPLIVTYEDDVRSFVSTHDKFKFNEGTSYKRALLSVSAVRTIQVFDNENEKLNIDVEVEPRAAHTKSHAGIFVCSGATNIIPNRQVPEELASKVLSSDIILQDVRWELLELAELQGMQL